MLAENASGSQKHVISHNSEYATAYMFRKDHKDFDDVFKGPPVRPLCDVSDSYGHRITYFLSNILKELYEDEPSVCNSTEDMLAAIHEVNNNGILECTDVIGSLDVKSLYPSLDVDFMIRVVCETFYISDITFKQVDYDEVGLYLSLTRDSAYLKKELLADFCPTRRTKYGRPPEITGSGIKVSKDQRFAAWLPSKQKPTIEKKRKMLTESLKVLLLLVMKNHVYCFDGKLRKQKCGGAIGVDLTGTLAQIFMSWWDKQFFKKLIDLGIKSKLYTRYIDDIDMCTSATLPGTRFLNGALSVDKALIPEEDIIPSDSRTFSIVKQVGDSIHPSIVLQSDVPSNYEDNKVPILDLKVWIGDIKTENGIERKILHEHYLKKVSSKLVMDATSALNMKTKRTILTQQCLKVILNCSPYLEWNIVAIHLTLFMLRLQASGYEKGMRFQILKSATDAYQKIKMMTSSGERPFYRSKEWKKTERRNEKERKRKSWYKKGGYEAIIFINATPSSELQKRLQSTINKNGAKIKVVERSGLKVISLLQKNNPFDKKDCRDMKCFICNTSKDGGCRKTGVVYQINCEDPCPFKYTGQSGSNAYTRGLKHIEDYEKKRETSPLWKHCVLAHNSEKKIFIMKVIDSVRHDPTKRQILEAIRIHNTDPAISMNDRSEWNITTLPRTGIITS